MTPSISRTHTLLAIATLAAALTGASAQAQPYRGPTNIPASSQAYNASTSTLPIMSVQTMLTSGRDGQKAILRGRIISHELGDHYTFDDGTGRIRIDLEADIFPIGVKIDDKTMVELQGVVDRDRDDVEFDVDVMRAM